jgi:hypothetical protein
VRAAALLVTAAIAGLPWTIRNYMGDRAAVRFIDGSFLSIPRGFSGRYTEVDSSWKLGYLIRLRVRPMADLTAAEINRVFYREDPHSMHRYTALALDNIRQDPVAFALACLYRAYRVFVVNGGIDEYTVKAPPTHRHLISTYRASTPSIQRIFLPSSTWRGL